MILVSSAFSADDIENSTMFEVLMFKSGVTSLTKDFENEKENINKNTEEIEKLKKEVKYLLQENIKLKFNVGNDGIFKREDKTVKTVTDLEKEQEKDLFDLNEATVQEVFLSEENKTQLKTSATAVNPLKNQATKITKIVKPLILEGNESIKENLDKIVTKVVNPLILEGNESTKNKKFAIVNAVNVGIYNSANPFDKSELKLYKRDKVELEYCDEYQWCKIYNKEQFIPQFKLWLISE